MYIVIFDMRVCMIMYVHIYIYIYMYIHIYIYIYTSAKVREDGEQALHEAVQPGPDGVLFLGAPYLLCIYIYIYICI